MPAGNHQKVAEQWAPIYYKDFSPEFSSSLDRFNPIDHPVSLFFDGNQDIRDNAKNILRLTKQQKKMLIANTPVYFSVVESETHFYLNYVLYHAVDANVRIHAHDTENVFMIISKANNELEALITNAHGYPMIYSDDVARQVRWRSRFDHRAVYEINKKLDLYSEDHHGSGSPLEYVYEIGSKRPKLFVSRKSHAIYRYSRYAWRQGGIYFPRSCNNCGAKSLWPNSQDRLFSYQLINWESFYDSIENKKLVFDWGKEKEASLLPTYLLAGLGEEESKVNLFYSVHFKTPYSLADPARLHSYLDGQSGKISFRYIYNPYLKKRVIGSVQSPRRKLD